MSSPIIHVRLQICKLSIRVATLTLTISHSGVSGVFGVSVVSALQHSMAALQEPGFLLRFFTYSLCNAYLNSQTQPNPFITPQI